MFDFIPARYYQTIYLLVTGVFSLLAYSSWKKKSCEEMLRGSNTNWPMLLTFCVLFVWIVGGRPIWGFGDTFLYAHQYDLAKQGLMSVPQSQEKDWLFNTFLFISAQTMDVHTWLTIIEAGYIFFALWGIMRLFGKNTWGAFLFFVGAFSFFSYGTNGIRNGLATSIVILAFSFLMADRPWEKIIGLFWCWLAISIHKSTLLPSVCMVFSLFVRNPKFSVGFWVASILLYLVAGSAIGNLFASMGFDDRMTGYMQNAEEYAEHYKSGFRIDFLIYSAMPIWLGYEVLVKRRIQSKYFPVLFNTYIFANSFWVVVMGVAFSNRFAYLSWFMYPLVLAYPCLKLNVWGNRQSEIAAKIMLAHIGFTLVMAFIYY